LYAEDVWVGGYLFPKNSNVMANISFIHYDPKLWPDPEKFDPSRFLDESGRFVAPKTGYVPFSVGKRFCVGQSLVEKEFFLFFSGLLQGSILQNFISAENFFG
jgi:cytochrome P450 family 2 subfamily U polypeptide 1